jgi:hypothetical protein
MIILFKQVSLMTSCEVQMACLLYSRQISYTSSSAISRFQEQLETGEFATSTSYHGYGFQLPNDWGITDVAGTRLIGAIRNVSMIMKYGELSDRKYQLQKLSCEI